MMNSTKGPKLNHRAASPTSRDNLGITSAQTSLQDELCPVVNTVTYRAFYWPFLVWNYYTCIRNTPKSKLCEKNIGDFFNVEYVKRNDFYFILGTLLNKDADHQNLAGIDNGRAALKSAGPYQYNDKYLQAYFGGMQYYGGGCDTLGFITGREQDSTPIPGLARLTESVGKPMGEAFDNVVKDTRYYKEYMLTDKPVPKDVLEELGDVLCIDMRGMDECKSLLKKALFEECDNEKFSNKYLIQSRDYLLFLYREHGIIQKPNDYKLREIIYDWFSPRGKNQYDYPENVKYAVKAWEAIVGRQYFTTAIELICNAMIKNLDVPKDFDSLVSDLIKNSDWKVIDIEKPIRQYIDDCIFDFDERETLISTGRKDPRKSCENALRILFSVYNRFVNREDISEKALACGEPVSIRSFITIIERMSGEPVKNILAYIMQRWIIDQNEAVAFEKLMQGRYGYLFERVDNSYSGTGLEAAAAFQGIRLVNLYQIMKDLDCFE